MKPRWVVVAAAFIVLAFAQPRAAHADAIISLDTSALEGTFGLFFGISNGGEEGDANVATSVTLSEFDFGGGGLDGDPLFDGAGVSGDFGDSVLLTDSVFFSSALQFVTVGDVLSFHVSTTNTAEALAPDAFLFSLLDADGNFAILTDEPGGSNALLTIEFDGIPTYTSYGVTITPAPDVTPVPEPGTLLLLGAGAALVWRWRS